MTDPITQLIQERDLFRYVHTPPKTLIAEPFIEDLKRFAVNTHVAPYTCSAPELIERGWPAQWVKHARSCPRRD